MDIQEKLFAHWLETRDRLVGKKLLSGQAASISVRWPDNKSMWFGSVNDVKPTVIQLAMIPKAETAAIHADIYSARSDVGAIALGGGDFGNCLADFGGILPVVFDEQARHIGKMPPPVHTGKVSSGALSLGGNVVLFNRQPACFGMTCSRLALNAELFEKCAKAYVLAVATGGKVKQLPWLVRYIANGRLLKDQRRATQRFSEGLLPNETKGY